MRPARSACSNAAAARWQRNWASTFATRTIPVPSDGTLERMTVSLHHVVIDTHDLPALARFWAGVLGWKILSEHEREIVIGPDVTASMGICFMPVAGPKTAKNRLHFDLTTGPDDRAAEIERILALGARRVDVGQTGSESWTVLADPEGNEFCVVRPKRTLIS
jgi:predicted enzyme related to lactoylglutathione lyase